MTVTSTSITISTELAHTLLNACSDAEQLWRNRRVRTSGYDYPECDDCIDRYDDALGKLARIIQDHDGA